MDKWLNEAEQKALNQALSNDARVLYLMGLKPSVDLKTGKTQPLNYKSLLNMLNAKESRFTLGRQVNSLIKELSQVELVSFIDEVDLNKSFNGKILLLPLLMITPDDYSQLHLQWQKMSTDWSPNATLYADLAKLVGIIDSAFSGHELGDFVAYWLGRPQTQFTQFQWTQKFVFNVKQKRLAKNIKAIHKVGNQVITAKAGVVADENAKNLVAKYSNKLKTTSNS
ncbi:DnaT-like ssDNA-binding domain-containing protein [Paraglaciecola polaris]|uniref:Flavodoxin n=1 Tax=Paraglaciecola polaris LMG 21857 TaxID=1129793 RepID=K7A6T2_9ALTE|nr:DnaT-like ssDNA-binding domain-containing protein [Paraglaciecola polaris]GAC31160.1 flavodoxin [Paraglaciecola polaris LMG 21857]